MKEARKRSRRREGMTLIEIMIVIVIMSMMAVAIATNVLGAFDEAKIGDAGTRARTIQSAVMAHILSGARGCPSVADLVQGELLDSTTESSDPWGNEYAIECEGNTIHVHSPGPDGTLGTEDDVGF